MIQAKDIKLVPISKLKHYSKNRNKHPDEQIKRLIKLIKYQGFRVPLVVDSETMEVIAGNGRLMAAKEMGLKQVPCTFQNFVDEAQRYAFMVSDNAIDDWAELQLGDISLEVKEWPDLDLELLGLKDLIIDTPDFEPSTEDEQGKLDQRQLKFLTCPHCQKEFEIEQAKMRTQD